MKNIIRIIVLFVFACNPNKPTGNLETIKYEILQAEADFDKMANDVGIKEAFLAFAADSAVLNRGGKAVKGIQAIKEYYENRPYARAKLTWKPDFVEVSSSGDLGYTYGKYTFNIYDSLENVREIKGIFHTVWKRQEDGSWKYVYD